MEIQERNCPLTKNPYRPIQISSDGVNECKSNNATLDVHSIRFKDCRVVYPHTITRPLRGYKLDDRKYFDNFIRDLCESGCLIKQFIGDNLKRAFARFALNHASLHPCEYCFQKGSSFKVCDKETKKQLETLKTNKEKLINQIQALEASEESGTKEENLAGLITLLNHVNTAIKELNRKTHVVWPASSANGELRSKAKFLNIVNSLNDLTKDEKKGITGKSILLNLCYFDFVLDIPCEYMHSTCLGVVKRLIEMTFIVGMNRTGKKKLCDPKIFNMLMRMIKVPREFPRRVRELDLSVMKAAEMRNIILFFFPVVIECIPDQPEERKVWLMLAYMIRACCIPSKEFQNINLQFLSSICKAFYNKYENVYSVRNCTYYTHVVGCHLLDMRTHGPLTPTSAFGFENFYGEMRNAFTPGTPSPLKQILTKIYLKRNLSKHTCRPIITYTDYDTSLECNTLIYTYRLQTYHVYKIVEITGDEINCVPLITEEQEFEDTPNIVWENVGVFKFKEEGTETKQIRLNDIAGKIIKINDLLITCPKEILEEK